MFTLKNIPSRLAISAAVLSLSSPVALAIESLDARAFEAETLPRILEYAENVEITEENFKSVQAELLSMTGIEDDEPFYEKAEDDPEVQALIALVNNGTAVSVPNIDCSVTIDIGGDSSNPVFYMLTQDVLCTDTPGLDQPVFRVGKGGILALNSHTLDANGQDIAVGIQVESGGTVFGGGLRGAGTVKGFNLDTAYSGIVIAETGTGGLPDLAASHAEVIWVSLEKNRFGLSLLGDHHTLKWINASHNQQFGIVSVTPGLVESNAVGNSHNVLKYITANGNGSTLHNVNFGTSGFIKVVSGVQFSEIPGETVFAGGDDNVFKYITADRNGLKNGGTSNEDTSAKVNDDSSLAFYALGLAVSGDNELLYQIHADKNGNQLDGVSATTAIQSINAGVYLVGENNVLVKAFADDNGDRSNNLTSTNPVQLLAFGITDNLSAAVVIPLKEQSQDGAPTPANLYVETYTNDNGARTRNLSLTSCPSEFLDESVGLIASMHRTIVITAIAEENGSRAKDVSIESGDDEKRLAAGIVVANPVSGSEASLLVGALASRNTVRGEMVSTSVSTCSPDPTSSNQLANGGIDVTDASLYASLITDNGEHSVMPGKSLTDRQLITGGVGAFASFYNVRVVNNLVLRNASRVKDHHVTSNQVGIDTLNGVSIKADAPTTRILITLNEVLENGGVGIAYKGDKSAPTGVGAFKKFGILENVVKYNKGQGIAVDGSNNLVKGNVVEFNRQPGIVLLTPSILSSHNQDNMVTLNISRFNHHFNIVDENLHSGHCTYDTWMKNDSGPKNRASPQCIYSPMA